VDVCERRGCKDYESDGVSDRRHFEECSEVFMQLESADELDNSDQPSLYMKHECSR